ncbi:MAG: sigma 54-interacting transcriptional regulator, partial [Candidatus Tectomicrobia bacterium]|nr:sigma 54-interacting transcriptional regulator [Candidatus Tectomicrobia bacterium]
MQDAAILSELVTSLDIAVIEHEESGRFRVVGALPAWCEAVYPALTTASDDLSLRALSPVLDNFLIDAEAFWQQGGAGRLPSGPWSEDDVAGEPCALEAFAVCVGARRLLGIERLGMAYEATRAVLQKARETNLDFHRLMRTEAALRTSHDDLLSILNELRLGTIMLDSNRQVTFLSQVCQRLLDTPGESALGRLWDDVSPFSAETNAALAAMSERPVSEREKVPVQLKTKAGQSYWMEVDIQDDPRDVRRKIICLYDVTEVHDLRRLLNAKAQFHDLVGKSEPMLRCYQQIQDVARVDTTVLIEGETGTGKELV